MVDLPRDIDLPMIVHAHYAAGGNFVVKAVDSRGNDGEILANAIDAYDGTFPVGFFIAAGTGVTGLHVVASGSWHLDIANAAVAPTLGSGRAGHGDAVLSYRGMAATAHLVHHGRAAFVVRSYGAAGVELLVQATGAYDARVRLREGPLWVAVTADGSWSISFD